LADKCLVQLAYAIGEPNPISVFVDTDGTGKVDDEVIVKKIKKIFPLTPKGIIKYLDLQRPIYQKTAAYGHFGRNLKEFTWEKLNKKEELQELYGDKNKEGLFEKATELFNNFLGNDTEEEVVNNPKPSDVVVHEQKKTENNLMSDINNIKDTLNDMLVHMLAGGTFIKEK